MPQLTDTHVFDVGDIVSPQGYQDIPPGSYEILEKRNMSTVLIKSRDTGLIALVNVDYLQLIRARIVPSYDRAYPPFPINDSTEQEHEDWGSCEDCGDTFEDEDDRYSNNYDDNYRCASCNEDYENQQEQEVNEYENSDIPHRDYDDKKFISRYKANTLTDIIQSKRGFGVEIEAYGRNYDAIRKIAKVIDNRIGISGDGSLSRRGFEIQFPLINGKQAEKMVKETCFHLKKNLTKVDETCGYHIHLQSFQAEHSFVYIQRLMFIATIFDDIIMSFLPKTRRQNRYCMSLQSYINLDEIVQARNKEDLELIWYKTYNKMDIRRTKQNKYHDSRYHGFNFHCYLSKMKHLEIRHHTGTINANKILQWANLHTLLLDAVTREVELESNIGQWELKDKFLAMFDKNFDTDFVNDKTAMLFDFIGLSEKSREYFISRQVEFNPSLNLQKNICVE